MPLFTLENVSFVNKDTTILKGLNLSIEKGDFISIAGPSGSGKSTFLKLLCHLISPTEGTIVYKGKSILQHDPLELRKNITYCFQTPYLLGQKVFENISFPYWIRNTKVDIKKVEELFHLFNLDKSYLNKEIKNLSGGEKQRIALIRSLLFIPEVLLLDEITSALDVENTLIVENVIKSFHKKGTTILWVTHDPQQSKRNGNKLLTIQSGQIKSLEVQR